MNKSLVQLNYMLFEKYWGDYGVGILPMAKDTKRFLLAHRSPHVHLGNTWNLISGGVFSDDQSMSVIHEEVLRELEEETGIDSSGIIKLIDLYIFEDKYSNFKFYNFLGIMKEEESTELNWETTEFKWVSFTEMLHIKPKHFGLKALLDDAASIKEIKKYSR